MEERDEKTLKTFNTAKLFAELVLFPLMRDYKRYQRQSNWGSDKIDDSLVMTDDIRDIQRFNGLKAMTETCHDLVKAISSTVRLKGNKSEVEKLKELTDYLDKIKFYFYEHRDKFFKVVYRDMKTVEVLDRRFFERMRDIVDSCYINTEILMTRNKLLFADANDEFMSDEEIKEAIKKEYIEN